jgi:DNA polymerase-3 subunit epsilon
VTLPAFIARYRACFEDTWTGDTSIDAVRFVVLDSETTGLNPRVDRLITVGAVAVRNSEILVEDSFDALIKVDWNTDAVTVHGVTRDQSVRGVDETVALERFLDYLKDGVIDTIDTALERHWGVRLMNRSLDTMDLTLHLERDGAFAGRPPIRQFTLDGLCAMFGVIPHDRHTASGDAFITAQVFLRLERLAARFGRGTLERISEPFEVEATP